MTPRVLLFIFALASTPLVIGMSAHADKSAEKKADQNTTTQDEAAEEKPDTQASQPTKATKNVSADTSTESNDPHDPENPTGDSVPPSEQPPDPQEEERTESPDGVPVEGADDKITATTPSFLSKLWSFLVFVFLVSAAFAALWLSMPFVRAFWENRTSEPPELTVVLPEFESQTPREPTPTSQPKAVAPDWPGFKGVRPQAHYLTNNFTTEELRTFLSDLEASQGKDSNGPYSPWGHETVADYVQAVRCELEAHDS